MRAHCKSLLVTGVIGLLSLSACSTNPATGESQFAGLMSPAQEERIGADEHASVMQTFGQSDNPGLVRYVNQVGQSVAKDTERADVQYKFFVLDTPMVNAFALPGGYVYVTRGLLALANSEAELASVLAHEIGHITGRHAAERYSHGMLSNIGALVIAAATDSSTAARAAGLGSNLYIKSYSRKQESQADELGIRYLHRAGYDNFAMARFLEVMEYNEGLERQMAGQGETVGFNYFSTHPATAERIGNATAIAAQYEDGPRRVNQEAYLAVLDGMIFGDSARHGFARGSRFYHPQLGLTFSVPAGFMIENSPEEVIAISPDKKAAILFDGAPNAQGLDPMTYLTQVWMKGEPVQYAENITVNGMPAATAQFDGKINGTPANIRIVAVRWAQDIFFRFQMAIPKTANAALVEEMKKASYSLRSMSAEEKKTVHPWRLSIVTAKTGDTVASLSRRQPRDLTFSEEHFHVLNGLKPGQPLVAGKRYKLVTE